MNRQQLLKDMRPLVNEMESLDKEDLIFETLLPLLTDEQLQVLNLKLIAGDLP